MTLTPAQKQIVRRMRSGIFPHLLLGEYRMLTRKVNAKDIQKLIDKEIIEHTKEGSILFALTPLGRTIEL